jgi:uncharacterized membrane protein
MTATTAIPARASTGWVGWAIFIFAALGLLLSALSLYNHYQKSATEYCDFGESFNCDIVNRSIYSEVGKVPVAAIGILGYAALMVLSRIAHHRPLALLMLIAALVGLGFALYLTYIEAYVLVVWCILCLASLAAIALITLLSAWQTARVWRT